jgi:hypothetical protein
MAITNQPMPFPKFILQSESPFKEIPQRVAVDTDTLAR